MKKLILLTAALVSSLFAEKVMVIYADDGTTFSKPIGSIDSVCFKQMDTTGLQYQTMELYNSWSAGDAAGDLLQNETFGGIDFNSMTGEVTYTYVDSIRGDIKTINSVSRATTLTSELISLNGARFVKITRSDFETPDKKVLLSLVSSSGTGAIAINESEFWFAKFGANRGCGIMQVSLEDSDDSMSSKNIGKVTVTYAILQ